MKLILKYGRPFVKPALIALLCIFFDSLLEMYLPMLMADIVGKGLEVGDTAFIVTTGIKMIVLSAVALLLAIGNARFSARAGVGVGGAIRKAVFEKVQTFSFKNIDDFSAASLVTRMTNDMTQIQNTLVMCLRMVIRVPIMLSLALVMAIRLNPGLSRVFYVVIPLLILASAVIAPKAWPLFGKMQTNVDNVNRTVQENITNVRVVKSFVREEHEKEKFSLASDELMNTALKAMNLVILTGPIMGLIMNGAILAVLYVGGTEVIGGIGNAADLSAFISYIMHVLISVMMVAMLMIFLTRASASFKRVGEVLAAETTIFDKENAFSLDEMKGEIEFRNVSFRYADTGEYVLEDISFTAKPGETVAIVGGTGSGKSSLVHLVPRLYDVSEGQVFIDGHDVREVTLESLRSHIGVVLQKNTLFSGTISQNLRWGNPDATDEEIRRAAQSAQIADHIEGMEDGYESRVEQGGANFSGGQKQRLCIARAMVKKPSVLIMDDSTSAVDTATERRIWEAFSDELKDTTVLLIAQRISSIMYADKIIVLDDGKMVGCGTHDQLMAHCEEYKGIYYSQKESGKEAV